MIKKPLICFYKDNTYIYSQNYMHVSSDSTTLLSELEEAHYSKMKVVKLNYELGSELLARTNETKECLLRTPNIEALILNKYEIITENELTQRLQKTDKFELTKKFKPQISKKEYINAIDYCHEGICKGDIYQVNLTFPFKGNTSTDSLSVFKHYHNKFHGNYHTHVPLLNGTLISMSPELFLNKSGNEIKTMPIKGTAKSNKEAIANLINSKKENAELSMIVDLLRNDLNSIANISGSKVEKHRAIMDLGDIAHTYSVVSAQSSSSLTEILTKTLPGGSISGCPKKRAVEYIDHMEKHRRDFYTGNLGWWKDNQCSFNILIRSFFHEESGNLYYHAGGGIVYDSDFEKEYDEVLLKAQRINS